LLAKDSLCYVGRDPPLGNSILILLFGSVIVRLSVFPSLPFLAKAKSGAHTFRRFRNTYLKNRTSCPEGVRQILVGLGGQRHMSDLYDKIREDVCIS